MMPKNCEKRTIKSRACVPLREVETSNRMPNGFTTSAPREVARHLYWVPVRERGFGDRVAAELLENKT
jgi:hypothetical protein